MEVRARAKPPFFFFLRFEDLKNKVPGSCICGGQREKKWESGSSGKGALEGW